MNDYVKNQFYSPAGQLGPHERVVMEKPSRLSIVLQRFKSEVTRPHSLSSALLLISVLSFTANITFLYLGYESRTANDDSSIVSESLASTIPVERGLGSDEDLSTPTTTLTVIPQSHYSSFSPHKLPSTLAEAYLVGDAETGEIILKKNPDMKSPMASVTKLLTAVVTKENIDLHHLTTVSKSSYNTYGSEGELALGEKILTGDLMYPLLIESSNDAAEVLADDFGREKFMTLLNEKAESLGMYDTFYDDPSGLSPLNKTTVVDLFKLALYVNHSYPELLDITRVRQYAILQHLWKNKNAMLDNPDFAGGKNGFIDEAKKTTVAFFNISIKSNDPAVPAKIHKIAIIILKSDDRNVDIASIIPFVKKNIRYEENSESTL